MCVYMKGQRLKKPVELCNTFGGVYVQQKKVGWEVIFSELEFAGSEAHQPRREFEGSALEPFFMLL